MNSSSKKVIIGFAVTFALVYTYFTLSGTSAPHVILIDAFLSQEITQEEHMEQEQRKLYNEGTKLVSVSNQSLANLVQISDLKEGDGDLVGEKSIIRLSYIGFLRDEETGDERVFDENLTKTVEFNLGLGTLIPGFEAGLVGMKENGLRMIIIQPEAGYGDREIPGIPANSVLHFIVEIHETRG